MYTPTEEELKVGDIIIVDKKYRSGGYKAEITWLGKLFARVKTQDDEWDIMRNRLSKTNY